MKGLLEVPLTIGEVSSVCVGSLSRSVVSVDLDWTCDRELGGS